MFERVLVANRGEIALRVIRACQELGVGTVAVYSDADREAPHVRAADEAFRLGPASPALSYLDVDRLLTIARRTHCDAVHPGYGFLAENAAFARACSEAGLAFVGPSAESIEQMGDKLAARAAAERAKVPVVPGTLEPVTSAADVRLLAKRFGYPLAVKAAAGGGGKGLKVAHDDADVDAAFSLAAGEAQAYFSNPVVYVERYLANPKHVEVQVLGDRHGNVVHLGERDCSMQRRHQKLIEETPACIPAAVRAMLCDAAVRLCAAIGYDSAGTVECLVEGGDFFFLEMNTRIQVEHAVTEMAYGVDLVKAQLRVAAGERLWFRQPDVRPSGHAIEVRVNAESPADDFRPAPGTIARYREPGGPGVRVDAAAFSGWTIPREYDSLVAKVITWGENRDEARARMRRALGEFVVEGVPTTIPLARLLLNDASFADGSYATPTVEDFVARRRDEIRAASPAAPEAAASSTAESRLVVEVNDKRFEVRVFGWPVPAGRVSSARRAPRSGAPKKFVPDAGAVSAPMHGTIADVRVKNGDRVTAGQVVAVIEAMKMMNEVAAPRDAVVRSVAVEVGQTVDIGAVLIALE